MKVTNQRVTRFLLCCVIALGSIAQVAGANPLTLADVFELETVSDPQISPDGSQVVYVRATPDIMTDRFYTTLWSARTDGSDHRPLTTGKRGDSSPRWSPTGDRLAYVSAEDGSAQVWLRYTDTGESHPISKLSHAPSGLTWSPDGKWLAFSMLVPTPPPDIAKMVPMPPGAEWATPAKVVDRLNYRFDPIGNLPRGEWHLFVLPAEGGTARQLTSGDVSFGGPGLRAGGPPVWTPDGQFLLIAANHRPESDLEPLDSEVYEVSAKDGSYRALTNRRGPDSAVQVSPDGKSILYTGFDDRYQGYQLTYVYQANRDGSNPRVLTDELGRSASGPRFSPDGKWILFNSDTEGRSRLMRQPNGGGELETVIEDHGGSVSGYAAAGGTSMANDGTIAFVDSSPERPGDVHVARPGETPVRLTQVNADVLDNREVASLEEIWFESSHDQRKVQGWILKPPGFESGTRYPLILEIHGGPFAAYGPRFDLEKQLMASAGYVVLYTNPRGSTSYGEDFGNLIHHDYPGDDFYDLISGVDAVIDKGIADPEQLYVTGGSGGGVLTSWVVGRSDRFKAAVTVYPVINWESWVLTADIPAFGYRYWFPGLPWEEPENYDKRSLLSVVENVTTPTMVLTGEVDYRTPMSESEQYYTALKLIGTESVLVRVPDENHGIRRRPSHWMQKIAHIIGWMDRYRESVDDQGTATMP